MNIQESIERMIRDTIRVRCSKVLLSPEMHHGCLDRISKHAATFGDIGPAPTSDVFVLGVPAEKCTALTGTDYALVPKSPENTVTADDIAEGYFRPIPPFQPVVPDVPDEQRPFHHFDTRKLLDALGYGSCLAVTTVEYVAGAILDPAVRKKVLEARVFEPE